MTRIRISHSWRTIRGAHIRIVHRRRVAVKSNSSITGWIVPAIVISFLMGCAQPWTAFPVIGFLDGGLLNSPIDWERKVEMEGLAPSGP